MARQDFVTQLTDLGFHIEEHDNDRNVSTGLRQLLFGISVAR